jgi:S-methylmethionine-dependent homocysteine/selenocysteine methylase
MTVLYPWHLELDEEFKVLKKSQEQQLDFYHKNRLEKLDDINSKVDVLISLTKVHRDLAK